MFCETYRKCWWRYLHNRVVSIKKIILFESFEKIINGPLKLLYIKFQIFDKSSEIKFINKFTSYKKIYTTIVTTIVMNLKILRLCFYVYQNVSSSLLQKQKTWNILVESIKISYKVLRRDVFCHTE